MKEFLSPRRRSDSMGITLPTIASYTSQIKGLSEHMNRNLPDKIRETLHNSGMNTRVERKALMNAADLHKYISSQALKMRTSHNLLVHKIPDISRIKTFRCILYVHKHKSHRTDKLDNRTEKGMSLRTVDGMNRVYMPNAKPVTAMKHVSIVEEEFPMDKRETIYYTSASPETPNSAPRIPDLPSRTNANRYDSTDEAEVEEVMSSERSQKKPASASSAKGQKTAIQMK